MAMVLPFTLLLPTGMGHYQTPYWPDFNFILEACNKLFLRQRQRILELFILERRRFYSLLWSGCGVGGDRQWAIDSHPC